jgi:3-oxoacyl-[acyl-carrier-protein] synthase I
MFVISTGMACSVGLSAIAACAAMRAGIAKFDELPYRDNQGEPIIGAVVPGLEPDLRLGRRLTEILALALVDCLGERPPIPTANIPLLVGLAEEGRPGGGASLADTLLVGVQAILEQTFHPTLSRAIPNGHTAGLEALRFARELLQNSDVPACLVCGVDSFINARSLLWLDQKWRLKRKTNSNGVIPGEAAGAVLVQRAPPKSGAAMHVAGLGFAMENVHILSEEPFLGLGLAEATRNALGETALPLHEMDFRLSDVTGESYGFKEQALLLARLMRGRRNEFPIWHCADSIGDTGAAAGVCHLVRAFEAFSKGYAPGKNAIGFASNVGGKRAAVILQGHSDAMASGANPDEARRGRS